MEHPGNYHIYVVDDEPQVCKAVSRILQHKYKVTCFESAEACFNRLRQSACKCDLLISDIIMPGMSGMELMQRVKRIRPLLEIVLITGYGDVPLAVRAIRAGARDFIEKPLHREKLLQTAESALKKNISDPIASKSLTKTEKKVLRLILQGMTNRHVGHTLQRSMRTIEDHRLRIMRKLGADSIVDLVQMARKIDLSDPD